jgi:hypothetical protein
MWPGSYFAKTYFAGTYWEPPSGVPPKRGGTGGRYGLMPRRVPDQWDDDEDFLIAYLS